MLKDHLKRRYTAKWWDDKEVEQEKLNNVLETTYLAPSKQGIYPYTVIVATNSIEGKTFKNWLFYDHTWCVDGIRGKKSDNLKVYNGQVLAPILLVYLCHSQNISNQQLILEYTMDTIVSATIAMCAAEEQGLQTGFCACLHGLTIAEKLKVSDATCTVLLGIGYATHDLRIRRGLYDSNDKLYGMDRSNTDPRLKISSNRLQKKEYENFYKVL